MLLQRVGGSCAESALIKFKKFQNIAARIITNASTQVLIKELKWHTVNDVIRNEIANRVLKYVEGAVGRVAAWHMSIVFLWEVLRLRSDSSVEFLNRAISPISHFMCLHRRYR